jgi:hypothetical protein
VLRDSPVRAFTTGSLRIVVGMPLFLKGALLDVPFRPPRFIAVERAYFSMS